MPSTTPPEEADDCGARSTPDSRGTPSGPMGPANMAPEGFGEPRPTETSRPMAVPAATATTTSDWSHPRRRWGGGSTGRAVGRREDCWGCTGDVGAGGRVPRRAASREEEDSAARARRRWFVRWFEVMSLLRGAVRRALHRLGREARDRRRARGKGAGDGGGHEAEPFRPTKALSTRRVLIGWPQRTFVRSGGESDRPRRTEDDRWRAVRQSGSPPRHSAPASTARREGDCRSQDGQHTCPRRRPGK